MLVAACGGGKKAGTQADTTTPAPAAPTATGATHEIQMVMQSANSFKFVPDNITIKTGDAVVFKGVSSNGVGHDVAFYPDSIPPGAADVLSKAIPDQSQPLATALIPDGSSVTVSFAGAPAGVYKFYCIPHMAMGMKGTITVTP
jgi:plastocyanin